MGDLTPRQIEILKLLTDGLTYKEIADKLGISVKTIDIHRANIMLSLRLKKFADLVKYAVRNGYTSID